MPTRSRINFIEEPSHQALACSVALIPTIALLVVSLLELKSRNLQRRRAKTLLKLALDFSPIPNLLLRL
jgi:hypothetical protein